MKKITVSIAVSRGEIDKLKECVLSVKDFASEILIFGIGIKKEDLKVVSTSFKFIPKEKVPYVELIRQEMIDKAEGDWVLLLDPDERITDSLRDSLQKVVEEEKYVAVNIPRQNVFFGSWIYYANWWPDCHIRFFKKGKVNWSTKIHSYPEVVGKVLQLIARKENSLVHYGYDSLEDFVARQKRYAPIDAEVRVSQGAKPSLKNLLWWPTRQFLVRLIKHRGFMHYYGYVLTFYMMKYEIDVWLNMKK